MVVGSFSRGTRLESRANEMPLDGLRSAHLASFVHRSANRSLLRTVPGTCRPVGDTWAARAKHSSRGSVRLYWWPCEGDPQ